MKQKQMIDPITVNVNDTANKSVMISIINSETLEVEFIGLKGDYHIVITENVTLPGKGISQTKVDGVALLLEDSWQKRNPKSEFGWRQFDPEKQVWKHIRRKKD